MKRFVPRYLDPASRLGEILFGLIMVLTVTLTAGLTVSDGKAGVRQLLLAAIGCNFAWGIIDAVMYIMNCITVRRGKAQPSRRSVQLPDRAERESARRLYGCRAWRADRSTAGEIGARRGLVGP
jgi:hypothetical protein